jgi:hypothetical protein
LRRAVLRKASRSAARGSRSLPASRALRARFDGDGLDLGVAAGGISRARRTSTNAYWCPRRLRSARRAQGRLPAHGDRSRQARLDRCQRLGRRFYQRGGVLPPLRRSAAALECPAGNLPAWIVAMHASSVWKYGLGAIIPFTRNLEPYLQAGYLKRAVHSRGARPHSQDRRGCLCCDGRALQRRRAARGRLGIRAR